MPSTYNPLAAAASTLVPVAPATSYFDTSVPLDIMHRYAMASGDLEVTRELVKAREEAKAATFGDVERQAFADRADMARESFTREKTLWDREDEKYAEKKEFEDVRGEFLESLASIPFDDPEFDDRVASLMTNPAAAEDDAVKALLNYKIVRRSKLEDDAREEARFNAREAMQWGEALGSVGVTPEVLAAFTDPGTGALDRLGLATALAGQKFRIDQSSLQRKRDEETYGRDPVVVEARDGKSLDKVVEDRKKAVANVAQKLGWTFAADLDSVVAAADSHDPSSMEAALFGKPVEELDPLAAEATAQEIQAGRAAVRSLWNAAHRRSTLPEPAPAPKPKPGDKDKDKDTRPRKPVDSYF